MNEVDHIFFSNLWLVMKPFENLAMHFLLHGFICAWSSNSFFWLCAWVSFNVMRYLKISMLRLLHCGVVFFLLGSKPYVRGSVHESYGFRFAVWGEWITWVVVLCSSFLFPSLGYFLMHGVLLVDVKMEVVPRWFPWVCEVSLEGSFAKSNEFMVMNDGHVAVVEISMFKSEVWFHE